MYNYNLEIPVSMESKATVSGKEVSLESDEVIEDAFRKLANEVKSSLDKNANFITDAFDLDVFEVSYSGDFDENEGTLYLDVVIDKLIAEEELENFLDKYCKANITHVEALDEEVITDEDDVIDATVVYKVSLKTFPNLIIVSAEDKLIKRIEEDLDDFDKRWDAEFDKYADKPMPTKEALAVLRRMIEFK